MNASFACSSFLSKITGAILSWKRLTASPCVKSWQNQGKLGEHQVRDLAMQMCKMLDYLHSLTPPVVHRDFTPEQPDSRQRWSTQACRLQRCPTNRIHGHGHCRRQTCLSSTRAVPRKTNHAKRHLCHGRYFVLFAGSARIPNRLLALMPNSCALRFRSVRRAHCQVHSP